MQSYDRASVRLRPGLWLTLGALLIVIGRGDGGAGGAGGRRVGHRHPVQGCGWHDLQRAAFTAQPMRRRRPPRRASWPCTATSTPRETQSPFAIEFARRGYVVLALDQRGHGYSGGAATTKGFGGPEGLSYLRSLPVRGQERDRARRSQHGRLDRAGRRHGGARRLSFDGAGGLLHRKAVSPRRARRRGRAMWRWSTAGSTNSPP